MAISYGQKTNVGNFYRDETTTTVFKYGTVDFNLLDSDDIVITKTVDREDKIYYQGDSIIFTIVIQNNSDVAVKGFVFKDTIDEAVIPSSGQFFDINTTAGTIVSASRDVQIDEINIGVGAEVTITIAGVIASDSVVVSA